MDVKAIYEKMGADYQTVLCRFMDNEDLFKKYLAKFVQDQTFTELVMAMERLDYEDILIKAHTIKGISINFDMIALHDSSSELVECIRNKNLDQVQPLFEIVEAEYNKVISILQELH